MSICSFSPTKTNIFNTMNHVSIVFNNSKIGIGLSSFRLIYDSLVLSRSFRHFLFAVLNPQNASIQAGSSVFPFQLLQLILLLIVTLFQFENYRLTKTTFLHRVIRPTAPISFSNLVSERHRTHHRKAGYPLRFVSSADLAIICLSAIFHRLESLLQEMLLSVSNGLSKTCTQLKKFISQFVTFETVPTIHLASKTSYSIHG